MPLALFILGKKNIKLVAFSVINSKLFQVGCEKYFSEIKLKENVAIQN